MNLAHKLTIMLRAAFAVLLALAGAAAAQDQVYLDADLDVGEDRPLQGHEPRALSITPTGNVVAVALERSILITNRLGHTRARIAMPASLEFVCVVATDDNDIAVLYRGTDKAGLSLFRHGPDGRLKRERRIADSAMDVSACMATRDNALLFLGSPGRDSWWLAKVSLDGVRIFEARSNGQQPERIAAMAARLAGHWYSLIQRPGVEGTPPDWYVHHHVDGKAREKHRIGITSGGYAAAMLTDGGVIAVNDDTLYFVDDLGTIKREASWPFHRTGPIVAGDDGFWAIVSHGDEIPDKLVRVDGRGDIRFRHPPRRIAGIARAPGNQIAVVVVSEDGRKTRLMRFDHRSGIEHLP